MGDIRGVKESILLSFPGNYCKFIFHVSIYLILTLCYTRNSILNAWTVKPKYYLL